MCSNDHGVDVQITENSGFCYSLICWEHEVIFAQTRLSIGSSRQSLSSAAVVASCPHLEQPKQCAPRRFIPDPFNPCLFPPTFHREGSRCYLCCSHVIGEQVKFLRIRFSWKCACCTCQKLAPLALGKNIAKLLTFTGVPLVPIESFDFVFLFIFLMQFLAFRGPCT